jgi:hypothetical protein
MVEWVEWNGVSYAELANGVFISAASEVDTVTSEIELDTRVRKNFKNKQDAKQWCITEARRILTEALEKLDG